MNPDPQNKRVIIHVDMDAFFAAVEQRRRPELKGRPVVVGGDGDPFKRRVVSAASYEARTYGIRSAMPLREAYRRCPGAVFLPVDFEAYTRASEEVFNILKGYSQLIEPAGLDEAFLDMTAACGGVEEFGTSEVRERFEQASVIAKDIKKRIREGTGLTASVGIGPNKLIAKIASDMNKPDGLTIIREEDIQRVLFPLPPSRLWGVGKKTAERLKSMGIETIGQLAGAPAETLMDAFRKGIGQGLHEHALGIDESPVITTWERRSMSREVTYQWDIRGDTRDMKVIRETLSLLAGEIAGALRQEGYRGRTITVKIRYHDFQTVTHAKTIPHYTDSRDVIEEGAVGLLSAFQWTKKVRLVGIRVSNFE
ncbi:MAG: DNA polymerase IV [Nitrospirae bacterium]|nr:DNA polymerase IV [Nitrospirota bacterium]